MFSVKACASGDEFQIIPDKPKRLDLESLKEKLKGCTTCNKYLIVLQKDGMQFSIYPTGKILVRHVKQKERAEAEASRLYALLGLA